MAKAPFPKPVVIKTKALKALKRRHPWVFSGGIVQPAMQPVPGQTVTLVSERGEPLAVGAYSPHSQIRVRIWSFLPDASIDTVFFHTRLKTAINAREALGLPAICTARRLVNAESDGLPGIIVDQYGDYLVCQFLSAGAEAWKSIIVEQLQALVHPKGVFERSDADVRKKEGLPALKGSLWGEAPPELVEIQIEQIRLLVDVYNGHKTGFYLDQCENQRLVTRYCANADVLNCFCYSGAFSLWALSAGAKRVTNIDASAEALYLAEQNHNLNGLNADWVQANVFDQLRRYRDERRTFDLIILDPPKFVAGARQLAKGSRGYKDINLLAMKLLNPAGRLFTFSCSGLVPPMLFQKIMADAAIDAERYVRIIQWLNQAADHPVLSSFPEGHYLKGLVCHVE